jgi:hypothetical protein
VRHNGEGAVTLIVRENAVQDRTAANSVRKRKRQDEQEKKARALMKRTNAENVAKNTVLVKTVPGLRTKLRDCGDGVGTKMAILKSQFKGRVDRGYTYPLGLIGMEYRVKQKVPPLKMSPSDGGDKFVNLQKLVEMMVAYDNKRTIDVTSPDTKVVRELPLLSEKNTCHHSTASLQKFVAKQLEKAKVQDDPVLVSLEDEYVGLGMYESDLRPKQQRKHYRCLYVSTGVYQGSDFYEATCAPIELADDGCWKVPERDLVPLDGGGFSQNSVKNESLWGVLLYDEGRKPTKQVYADEYVQAHKKCGVLMK